MSEGTSRAPASAGVLHLAGPCLGCTLAAMCATCVAQGAVYAGGALAGLQVMAARARRRVAAGSVAGEGAVLAPDVDRPAVEPERHRVHDHAEAGQGQH